MSIWGTLFGSKNVIKQAANGIYNGVDKAFYTKEEKAQGFLELLKAYEPFKIAQRLLALVISIPYVVVWLMSAAMLELPAIRQLKAAARRRIEREVGDVYDLLADQAKQIEALTALLSRMAVEYYGGASPTEEQRQNYLERSEAVIAALDSNDTLMRADAEPAYDLIMRSLGRSSLINKIVSEDYLPRRNEVMGYE